jgi:hypothetical protein
MDYKLEEIHDVYFGDTFQTDEMMLIEMSPEMLDELLSANSS